MWCSALGACASGDPMAQSDDQMLADAVRGDRAALTALLQRYGPQVRRGLHGKLSAIWQSVLDEDDIMQVTYLEAYLRIERFTPAGVASFIAWLTRIAENNLRDAIKELERDKRPQPRQRVVAQSAEESFVALVDVLGVTTSTASRHVGRREICQHVEAAVRKLPPAYEKVIRLYDLEGRPANEVAEQVGRSVGAMYMLRARAHERLQEQLGSESQYFTRTS